MRQQYKSQGHINWGVKVISRQQNLVGCETTGEKENASFFKKLGPNPIQVTTGSTLIPRQPNWPNEVQAYLNRRNANARSDVRAEFGRTSFCWTKQQSQTPLASKKLATASDGGGEERVRSFHRCFSSWMSQEFSRLRADRSYGSRCWNLIVGGWCLPLSPQWSPVTSYCTGALPQGKSMVWKAKYGFKLGQKLEPKVPSKATTLIEFARLLSSDSRHMTNPHTLEGTGRLSAWLGFHSVRQGP